VHYWIVTDKRTYHGVGNYRDVLETIECLKKKGVKIRKVKGKFKLGQRIRLAFLMTPMRVASLYVKVRAGRRKKWN